MDFFESVGKVVTGTAQIVVKKSSDMLECTKLVFTIRNEQEKIKSFYREIGKTIYGTYKNHQPVSPDIADYCKAIDDIHREIATLKETLAKLRNTKICPSCKTNINMGDVYCPICGHKQEPVKASPAPDSTPFEDTSCSCGCSCGCGDEDCDCDDEVCDCGEDCDCGEEHNASDEESSCKCSEDSGCGCGEEFKQE
ncbi:MAG: hypothetical protein AB9835_03395 [Eubacteriales bacterium]